MAGVIAMPTPENYYRGVGPAAPEAPRPNPPPAAGPQGYGTHRQDGAGPHGYGAPTVPAQKAQQAFLDAVSPPAPSTPWTARVPWYVWLGAGIGIALAGPPATRWAMRQAKTSLAKLGS